MSKIRPFPRNHPPYPALRRIHIAVIPRYQVQVHVINRLAGSAADVDADVETGRVETLTDDGRHIVEQLPAGSLLVGGKLEIGTAVPPRNHQHVTGIYRVFVENGECSAGFQDWFSGGIGVAEGAGGIVLSWNKISWIVCI